MNEIEVRESLKRMEESRKEITASKDASMKFLVDAGIIDGSGKLQPHYQDLCIPLTPQGRI
jgi:hypothetical protein